jgi:hypothetical protein
MGKVGWKDRMEWAQGLGEEEDWGKKGTTYLHLSEQ